jgi:hypothetical protein
MESQAQTQEEQQQLQSTPVLVTSPEMDDKTVQQSSVWWVNTKDKQRLFFVISKNKHNHDSKTLTGFWVNEHLDKNEGYLSVKINFKDMNGRFQTGWVNVSQMTMVSEDLLDKTFGQSTKGFVHKVMDNFSRKIIGTSQQQKQYQGGRGRQEYSNHRGNGRGRGRQEYSNHRGNGRGRGSRSRGQYQPRQHQEQHQEHQEQHQEQQEQHQEQQEQHQEESSQQEN